MIEASFEAVIPKAINAEFEAIIPREKAFDIVNKDIHIDTNGKYEVKADAGTAMTQVNVEVEVPTNVFQETMIDNTGGGVKGFNHVSISEGVTSLTTRAYAGTNIVSANLPNTLTSIGVAAFSSCVNLKSIDIPNSVIIISQGTFSDCSSLASPIKIPKGISTLPITIFYYCTKVPYFDFRDHEMIPVLENINTFGGTSGKFVVPDKLYDRWIEETNWATYKSRIVKASEFVEPTNN